ncbi:MULTISPECIES: U32 family peptidase [unclassified Fusibacter]|uniref:peptidase U32 family protein n=1 Tax=unclassified Fusibacter TaxID=2624464 RepID=UPI001013BF71|nr:MULTISPECIES: U32 family peptidase C-terminal domain-containing protein [unclassified Fusibacter]MCK8058910.1 U32 family peptidase C-terminal domain-containing protein [Fusibacter sp. A2]NPE21985.1 U32 family peptidase [Fusibacter sp. A1]RXV61552.1 U32 family peptidase [Fusibacter sp. A1]
MKKIELLAPAGDLDKLKFAINYGADAVYIGGEVFGLRASSRNFNEEQMLEGIEYAHSRGKKVFLTLNIIPHNEDLNELNHYIEMIKDIPFDAFILSDPGTFMFIKEKMPDAEIHLSTQANNTNYMSARFWHEQGIKRVILARELSFEEIAEIKENTPDTLELESFVHGAMCISYSGRCLISNYMSGRNANKGECSHPCRWKYHLVEETRPGEYFPVTEDEGGTYFFNSKDLCMIEFIPELINSGLDSLKIEGRSKSVYYVANVVRVYREAIDTYYKDPENYTFKKEWIDEIEKASHREFTTGFYQEKAGLESQLYSSSAYIREYDFAGVVKSYDESTGLAEIEQRNRIFINDEIEIIGPDYFGYTQVITEMYDKNHAPIEVAPHAQQTIYIKMEQPVKPLDIIRKQKGE